MNYDLKNKNQLNLFQNQVKWLIDNEMLCKLTKESRKRSITENSSLHLWMKHISDELNEIGETFHYFGISGKEFEMKFTEKIVKEFVIKPIIITLFNIESTTKLTNSNINELIDIINKFMSKKGIYLPWPSISSLIEYHETKK